MGWKGEPSIPIILITITEHSLPSNMNSHATIISLPKLGIEIEPSMTRETREPSVANTGITEEYRVSATIRPLSEFSHKYITAKKYHVIIALDISGSMTCMMNRLNNDPHELTEPVTRLECCIRAIKKLLEFFRVLTLNGIEIYFTLTGFNHSVRPVFEHVKVPSRIDDEEPMVLGARRWNMDDDWESIERFADFAIATPVETVVQRVRPPPSTLRQMNRECNYIGSFGSTNIQNVVTHTNEIRQRYGGGDNESIETISILLSDGYVTSGMTRVQLEELTSQHPEMKYDVTIGIGEESDYDAQLLRAMTREEDVRGCPCIDDLYDNMLSSIFHKMNLFARNVECRVEPMETIAPLFEYTTNPTQYQCERFTVPEFRFSQFIGFTTMIKEGNGINVTMNDVPIDTDSESDEKSTGESTWVNDEWKVVYSRSRSSGDTHGDIPRWDIRVSIRPLFHRVCVSDVPDSSIQNNTMTNYMKLTRDFNQLDMENMQQVNEFYSELNQWMADVERCDATPVVAKMKSILTEIHRRITLLVELEEQRHQEEQYVPREDTGNDTVNDTSDVTRGVNYRYNLTDPPISIFNIADFDSMPDDNVLPDSIPLSYPQIYQANRYVSPDSLSEPPSAIQATPYNYNGYRSVQATPSLTPSQTISSIRAMRTQSRQGNYAFVGRMMTESYSQPQ